MNHRSANKMKHANMSFDGFLNNNKQSNCQQATHYGARTNVRDSFMLLFANKPILKFLRSRVQLAGGEKCEVKVFFYAVSTHQ